MSSNVEKVVLAYSGGLDTSGRSDDSLFDETIATFEDDGGAYDRADADGFIELNALRLRNLAAKRGILS